MAKETPFVPVKIKCPFCETESVQRYIKSRMFQPDIVEDDSHVATYKWENMEFANVRPNLYHIWHCPSCHFCDEKETFRGEDNSAGKLEMIKEKMLIYARMPGSLISRMGGRIDFSGDLYSAESAIFSHLLAIYIQELLSPNMRQFSKLARLYLRTAWLFREQAVPGAVEVAPPEGCAGLGESLESFRGEWPGIPAGEETALKVAIDAYNEILNRSSGTDVKFEINVMTLVIAMYRRQGKNVDALRMARSVFSAATKARQSARAAVQKGVNVAQNQGVLNFCAGIVDKMTTLAEELGDIVFKEELPAAKEAVLKMGPVDAQAVLEKLRELKFSDITCRRVSGMFAKQAGKK